MANKKARVLVDVVIDGTKHAANTVVSLSDEQLNAHAASVDTNEAAVKYAEGLEKPAK